MRSRRRPPGPSPETAELTPLGETLRRRRLERALTVADAAAELGIPSSSLRAIEWNRLDLLGSPGDADRIQRSYSAFLGVEVGHPPKVQSTDVASPRRGARRTLSVLLLAGLAAPLVIAFLYFRGEEKLGGTDGEPANQLGTRPRLSSTVSSPETRVAPPIKPPPAVPKRAVQPPMRLVLTAARGDSWVEVHSGSPSGPLLFRGTLLSGRTLRLSGQRLWLRLGAASNLALAVNGKRAGNDLQGTVDVLVTRQGIRRA